jgi:DNA-binding transcriptional MerR regulator
MSDSERGREQADDELMAIPRIAEAVGVTPRVVRYWEEQGLISPSREHGKLRYSPRDMAIARLTKRLLDSGMGVEGLRMLKELSERDIRRAATSGDERDLIELALRILYQRKAFREVTGMDEEHYPEGRPPPPPHRLGPKSHGGGPKRHGPGPKAHGPKAHRPHDEP